MTRNVWRADNEDDNNTWASASYAAVEITVGNNHVKIWPPPLAKKLRRKLDDQHAQVFESWNDVTAPTPADPEVTWLSSRLADKPSYGMTLDSKSSSCHRFRSSVAGCACS